MIQALYDIETRAKESLLNGITRVDFANRSCSRLRSVGIDRTQLRSRRASMRLYHNDDTRELAGPITYHISGLAISLITSRLMREKGVGRVGDNTTRLNAADWVSACED